MILLSILFYYLKKELHGIPLQQKNIFITILPDIRYIKRRFSGDDSGIILF